MDFRAQYLQAMRDQDPERFKRLSQNGQLLEQANLKARQAEKMFRDLTDGLPRDETGQLSLQASREAEEQVKAAMFEFQDSQTSPKQDEQDALRGDRPILSPE
jgi:hypothetical protein